MRDQRSGIRGQKVKKSEGEKVGRREKR